MTVAQEPQKVALARGLYNNAYLVLALASLCWSGNHLMGRAIAGHVPPLTITTLRWLLAALILFPFIRGQLARDWPLIARHIGVLIYLALIGGGIFGALQFVGLQLTTALNVSVMNSLAPLFIAAASAAMFGDRLTIGQAVGITVSLIGVLAIITKLDPAALTHFSFNTGDILILINMALWGVYSASMRWRPAIHPTSFMFMFCLISGIAMLPAMVWEYSTGFRLQPTALTFGSIAFVTLFSTITAFMCWTRGVELIGPNRAGVFLHLVPIFSALLTGVLLGEPLMGYHVVGFALILAGVTCAARRP
ncbi:MAG: DMT family transporter [Alphaproteobacteria bacterium]